MKILSAFTLLVLALLPLASRATLYRVLDAEDCTIPSATTWDGLNDRKAPWSMTETVSGLVYTNDVKGLLQGGLTNETISRVAWIETNHFYAGAKSIFMRFNPTPGGGQPYHTAPDGNVTDKMNYKFIPFTDANAQGFGDRKYFSFALYLPPAAEFQAPVGELLLAQWWQGTPYSPPLSLHLDPQTTDGKLHWRMEVRNNDTGGLSSSSPVLVQPADNVLAPATWHTFVVQSTMSWSNAATGKFLVWLNGVQVLNWTGKIGYDPSRPAAPKVAAHPNAMFELRFGPYRSRQPKKLLVGYDELRWASTYAEAAPIPPKPDHP